MPDTKKKQREYHKKYWQKNKKRINKKRRERYKTDVEYRKRLKERSRAFHKKNPTYSRDYNNKTRKNNPERIKRSQKKWRTNNEAQLYLIEYKNKAYCYRCKRTFNGFRSTCHLHHPNNLLKLHSTLTQVYDLDEMERALMFVIPLCANCHAEVHECAP
ncbi:MAG: hypothetical protein GWN00_12200 [Aliifodinibius sp.]|nr:hypothetical protein [Fodinibius sp.]NIV11896.1 hypothetical protein [Fodinibius sp.]NIY25542.1 hypothetical protein [Fodinibius sp.]